MTIPRCLNIYRYVRKMVGRNKMAGECGANTISGSVSLFVEAKKMKMI